MPRELMKFMVNERNKNIYNKAEFYLLISSAGKEIFKKFLTHFQ